MLRAPLAIFTLVALGCQGRAAPTTMGHRGGPPAPPPCVAIAGTGPWQAELFPSCPRPPLPTYPTICADPATCARPCAASGGSRGMRGDTWSTTYHYDPAGRWQGATSDRGEPVRCTWRDDRLEGCTIGDWSERAIRAPDGTLTAIVLGDERHTVGREPGGRVIAIDDQALRYDGAGRIVQVGDRHIDYDADGRILGESDRREVWRWSYDERGRVIKIISEWRPPPPEPSSPSPSPSPPSPSPPSPPPDPDVLDLGDALVLDDGEPIDFDPHHRTYVFHYDEAGRLVALLNLGAHEDDSSGISFEYDCE